MENQRQCPGERRTLILAMTVVTTVAGYNITKDDFAKNTKKNSSIGRFVNKVKACQVLCSKAGLLVHTVFVSAATNLQ